jgi:hypothetical protein
MSQPPIHPQESAFGDLTGTFLEPLIADLITGLGEDVTREGSPRRRPR